MNIGDTVFFIELVQLYNGKYRQGIVKGFFGNSVVVEIDNMIPVAVKRENILSEKEYRKIGEVIYGD